MREDGIAGISPRTWHPPTTVHGDDPFPVPDLVEREFDQGERDVAGFSDITYLRTAEGWAYLCVVRDGHTRRVLGRCVADNMHTDLVEAALRQAVALRGVLPRKVVFHADRGTQAVFNRSSQHRRIGVSDERVGQAEAGPGISRADRVSWAAERRVAAGSGAGLGGDRCGEEDTRGGGGCGCFGTGRAPVVPRRWWSESTIASHRVWSVSVAVRT